MMIEVVGVVNVDVKRANAFGLDSTKILLDKSDVDNFAKNVF